MSYITVPKTEFDFRNTSPEQLGVTVLDSHCVIHYSSGQAQEFYLFENSEENQRVFENLKLTTFKKSARTMPGWHYVYNVDRYDDVPKYCKCGTCHLKHKDNLLFKFFKINQGVVSKQH